MKISPPPRSSATVTHTKALSQTRIRPTGGVEVIHAHAQLVERRREPRFDCEEEGTLIMMTGGEVLSCRLIDQSSGGARVMHARTEPINGEMWLVRKGQANVCRASTAWSMPHRVGLKFNLIQKLSLEGPRPTKVPEAVHAQWLKLNAPKPPEAPSAADAFFLD